MGAHRLRPLLAALAATVVGLGMQPHSAAASTNATAVVTGTASPTLVAANNTAPGFAATLTGLDQTVTAAASFDVIDATGTGSGWNVTLSGAVLSNGSHTLPQPATAAAATFVCDSGSTCSIPTSNVGFAKVNYPLTVSPTAAKLYSAAAGTGLGQMTGSNTWSLLIPANAEAGSYTATWTYSIVSGP